MSSTASATSRLEQMESGRTVPSASRMVTMLVSCANPAPAAETSLATMTSRFFRASFFAALSSTSAVSAAKPTNTCPAGLEAPRPARMSLVCSSMMTGASARSPASPFLIFCGATSAGRKSATAAAMTITSASACAPTASSISAADSTRTSRTPSGGGSGALVTSVTSAPRSRAAVAIA